ncbi:ABC transporter ATP-binding protein [Streptomyces griseoruber]|uniref:ABC transporter n=1 Tax=Streptomyces griseoruber TaxID=1943 RepID=A0A117R7D1_9ACTN|nr:ABC transporter ATP-binding protein [Streptomyces griseoruber]KUN75013.1 ABC transporter [Streptomyces griseoruber]
MSTTHATTKDRSAVRTLLRLWPYVRPVRVRLFTAASVAVVASCVGLVIPLVLKWMVDGPVADRDPAGVWLGALYLLLLGLLEAGLFGLRRWLVARPLSHVEAEMRAGLYGHLQRLPVAFHDRWASGQLLSRATTDLMLLRMFLAFPLTFLLVNAVTILAGVIIMLLQDWSLGLVILGPALPVMVMCVVFENRYAVVARLAQDQVGDLTTVVEESVLGIRIIKGFGRHRSQARAFRTLSSTLRGTELRKARLLATIWAVIVTLPEVAIGAALVLGTVQVADGELSAGTLVAFLSTALALRWPVDSIGFLLAMSQEAATATERYFEVMDEEPESETSTGSRPADAGGAGAGVTATGSGDPGVTDAGGGDDTGAGATVADARAADARRPTAGSADATAADTGSPGDGSAGDGSAGDGSTPATVADAKRADATAADARRADATVPEAGSAGGGSTGARRADATVPEAGSAGDGSTGARRADATVADARRANARNADDSGADAGKAGDGLRFVGVVFRYPDADPASPPTLDRVDLHIRPGESMALVGATGSGKTTLTALVPRLHEVTAGRITIDGEDVTAMTREELRAKVAVAFEEPTLFSASVGENVLMGAGDQAGAAELERALGVAQAEFVHALPQGTATQVGEQGLSLSGGQRQRLALARAVVGQPRFLVLDDPLSALDVHTEAAVEAALRQVLADTTALIVAHRPSTVLLADRVALLSGGRITAVGTHQELLRANTEYAHLMSGNGRQEDDR